MAWQYPKYSCGHNGERYQAYGHHSSRERQLAMLEAQVCPECRAATAEKLAKENGLPVLIGSPKQVAWASDIRARAMRLLSVEQIDRLRPEATAKWWIDNRERLF